MEQVNIVNQKGEVVNNFQLNSKIWHAPLSHHNVSLYNRHYSFNQRQATSKVKSRGEIVGSTRKIYRQKGTGGARHGHRYAPQFRGGGVAFGPTGKENYSLKVNAKLKKKVFQSLLSEKMQNKEIIVVDKVNLDVYKTKEAEKFLKILPIKEIGRSKTLLVLADNEENKQAITRSFRNLPYVNTSDSKSINPNQLLFSNYLIFTHSALTETEKRLSS
jgi:large subunit ribosomal protein L4